MDLEEGKREVEEELKRAREELRLEREKWKMEREEYRQVRTGREMKVDVLQLRSNEDNSCCLYVHVCVAVPGRNQTLFRYVIQPFEAL